MKPWYMSLTIRGGIVAIIATAAPYLGLQIATEDAQALIDAVCAVIAAAGALTAIIGRLRANQQIGKTL